MQKIAKNIIIGSIVGATVAGSLLSQAKKHDSQLESKETPKDLSWAAWKRVLVETKNALKDKELGMLAAALAYYGTFSFFPTLVAFISIFSLIISPDQLAATITAAESYLPRDIAIVVASQLTRLTEQPQASLIAAGVSIAIALWGSSGGVQNLLKATNHAYDVEETRSFVRLRLISAAFVLGGFLLALPMLGLLVLKGNFLVAFGAPEWTEILVNIARWVVVVTVVSVALAVIYRYGPDRKDPKWQWVSWGAIAATLIWALGSALFFFYLQNFADYQASYGVFAGIIAMMLWLNLSSLIILVGAVVNHRLEEQTEAVTTV